MEQTKYHHSEGMCLNFSSETHSNWILLNATMLCIEGQTKAPTTTKHNRTARCEKLHADYIEEKLTNLYNLLLTQE